MQVTIELTPNQEKQLRAAAQAEGLDLATFAQRRVTEQLPVAPASPPDEGPKDLDRKRQAAIAMLKGWIAEGTTDDPEVIRRAEEEVEELKRNLNANLLATGERPVFR